MTSAEVANLEEDLKLSYKLEFEEIKTSPLNTQSLRNLEQIYVRLELLREKAHEQNVPVTCDELFKIFANEHEKSRIALVGEAGVGKTTLLAKIAYDWAIGHRLHDVKLLFFVRLRQIQQYDNFAEILRTFVSDGLEIRNESLFEYLRTHQREIMFLLDGLDEYKGDITQATTKNDLVQIMRGDIFKRATVIVTTRPWRAGQILSIDTINKKYRRISVKGFIVDGVQEYIRKFFSNDKVSAESLIQLTTMDNLVAETMTPYPIFCCMLCHMWEWLTESKRERVRKLETFSQFITEMINALIEQYASN